MSQVTKSGRYIARATSIGLEEKSSGTVQVGITFAVETFIGPPEEDCSGQQITAFFNLIKKDLTLNDINIRSLKDALGWDGASFAALENTDWSQTQVQIVIADGTDQNGNPRLEVKYINPKDYVGGMKKADASTIQSLDAKYGAMLRAMNGGKPGNGTSAKPNGAAASPPADSMGKQLAWQAFTSKIDAYGREHPEDPYTSAQRVEVFKAVLASACGKDPKTFTPADWVNAKKHIVDDFSPAIRDLLPL